MAAALCRAQPNSPGIRGLFRRAMLVVAVVSLVAAAPLVGAAQAADNGISATLATPDVTLTPDGSARVVLVVSAGPSFTGGVVVRPQPTETSVAVAPVKVTGKLQAGGSTAMSFVVTRASEGSGQDVPVTFVVSSQTKPVRIATATLAVKAAASAALVEAGIESNVTTVDENRPGEAALVITNPRQAALHVDALEVSAPVNVDIDLTCPTAGSGETVAAGTTRTLTGCPLEIAPRSQAVMHIELAPANAVTPGPRSLLVKIDASGPAGSAQSVVTTLAFTVDVFAESDILKSIGVPVFLLLPGIVIVLTSWFLIRWVSPWRRTASAANINSIGSAVSAATFTAVVSLAVSLAVARVYPWLTRTFLPGYERDYLKAYGFQDFYYVIGYSFVIAVVVWLFASLLWLVTPLIRVMLIPMPDDRPAELLRKIGLRGFFGGDALFPRIEVDNVPALDLGNRAGGKAFIAPMIEVDVLVDDPTLRGAIQSNGEQNRAFKLWWTLVRAEEDGKAVLSYRSDDAPPQEVARSKVVPSGSFRPIAEVHIT